MSVYYELTRRISAGDTGLYNQCRPSGVLGLLQEAATLAACEIGLSRDQMLRKYNAIWMVARIWYRLDRPLRWDEAVTVRTWHRADRGAAMYRDYDLSVDGVRVGEAVSTWVLADVGTRRLMRMSRLEEGVNTGGGALCRDRLLGKVRLPEPMAPAFRHTFRYSDADVNGHVNNVRYADCAADALELEKALQAQFVSSLQIGYLSECMVGETIGLYTGDAEGTQFVHGADDAGKSRFDAALRLSPLPGT